MSAEPHKENYRFEGIQCTSTRFGDPILVLSKEDLERLQKKRKLEQQNSRGKHEARSSSASAPSSISYSNKPHELPSNTFSSSSIKPFSASTPTTMETGAQEEYDLVNFVYFYPHADFSGFAMEQYFIDSSKLLLQFDPFDPQHRLISPKELWNQRSPLFPKGPLTTRHQQLANNTSSASEAGFFQPYVSYIMKNNDNSNSNNDNNNDNTNNDNNKSSYDSNERQEQQIQQRSSWCDQAVLLHRLLPLSDTRRQVTTEIIRHYNSVCTKRLFRLMLTPAVHWSNKFVGIGDNPYGPNEVNLHGEPAVSRYYEMLSSLSPDAVQVLLRSEIFVTAEGKVLVAMTRVLYATRVFRGVSETLQDITLTAPTAFSEHTTGAVNATIAQQSNSASTDIAKVAEATIATNTGYQPTHQTVAKRKKSTLKMSMQKKATIIETEPTPPPTLDTRELLSDTPTICAIDVTFLEFAPSVMQAHRVKVYHCGVT